MAKEGFGGMKRGGGMHTRDPKNFHGKKSSRWQNLPFHLGNLSSFGGGNKRSGGKAFNGKNAKS